jgi:hypothetical protein
MLPATYLMTAPDTENGVGRSMSFADLKRGLLRANAKVVIPTPREFAHATGFCGLTAIYIGEPGNPFARQITSVRAGMIPEFTIIRPDGSIQTKGWRAILEKCVTARVATRARMERIFRVDLGSDRTAAARWCSRCQRAGKWTKPSGKDGLCDDHADVASYVRQMSGMREIMRDRFPDVAQALDDAADKQKETEYADALREQPGGSATEAQHSDPRNLCDSDAR